MEGLASLVPLFLPLGADTPLKWKERIWKGFRPESTLQIISPYGQIVCTTIFNYESRMMNKEAGGRFSANAQ